MTTQFYQIHADSPENIQQHRPVSNGFAGFGFSISDPADYPNGFTNVMVWDGKLFVSTSLFDTLTGGNARWYNAQATVGRTRYFSIERHFDDILKHIEYERRSDRERNVQKRNRAIFEYLIDIL